MKFIVTDTFLAEVRKFTQNKPNLKTRIEDCMLDFQEHLFNSKYYRKPLKWYEKEDVHELQVGGDPRIFIQFYQKDKECYYLNFWTHSSLELSGRKKLKIRLHKK